MTEYRRSKPPPRELYTPGSGPLRKSGNGTIQSLAAPGGRSEMNIQNQEDQMKSPPPLQKSTAQCSDNKTGEPRIKPGAEIYVPKPVADAQRKTEEVNQGENGGRFQDRGPKRRNDRKRKERNNTIDFGVSLGSREKSSSREQLASAPVTNNAQQGNDSGRHFRHGSEPRTGPTFFQDNRNRDSKSSEPSNAQDRFYNKSSNFGYRKAPVVPDNVPPRFRKQMLARLGLPTDDMAVSPSPTPPPPVEWSRTLPGHGRGRGRNRLWRDTPPNQQDDGGGGRHGAPPPGMERVGGFSRENVDSRDNRGMGRPRVMNRNSHERDVVPVRPSLSDQNLHKTASTSQPNLSSRPSETLSHVLDWAAEVENEEEMRLSRVNSKESISEATSVPKKSKKKKKKKRSDGDRPNQNRNHTEEPLRNQFNRHSMENLSKCNSPTPAMEKNWRDRTRRDSSRSRQSSFCDPRSRQSSLDRRSRKNSSCDNRSRQSSLDRSERARGFRGGGGGGGGYSRNHQPMTRELSWRAEQPTGGASFGHKSENRQAGIIVLPQPLSRETSFPIHHPPPSKSAPPPGTSSGGLQRKLFDPSNPDRPIVVHPVRHDIDHNFQLNGYHPQAPDCAQVLPVGDFSTPPIWYNPYKENFQRATNPNLIRCISQADFELCYLLNSNEVLQFWDKLQHCRSAIRSAFRGLMLNDFQFCETENVESHIWKILYYNLIELLRQMMTENTQMKDKYKAALLEVVNEGLEFYEMLLNELEQISNVKLENYLNPCCKRDGLGGRKLVLFAAQKIYLSLGDLARYKEQTSGVCNYAVPRQWYLKAQQINPKNGRPYNQLAILARYTNRRLDAVYYFMRCLMSSKPMPSVKDSLNSLFDDNRKKFEAVDRKRKEERAKREREKMKEKESGGSFIREIWVHPSGGKNYHRTTSTCVPDLDSEDEELYSISTIELNRRFTSSYLHVLGKLFMKIGLEGLTEAALQMLKEFRALLQHSSLPLSSSRFLQLFALNMFAIEVTQPKGDLTQSNDGVYRSAVQESALVVSLQMFNIVLEKFVELLREHLNKPNEKDFIPADCVTILPSLKIWCDWMTTHVEVWTPPPSCQDYKVGPAEDCWSRIAILVTLLDKMVIPENVIVSEQLPDYQMGFLTEDCTLAGFTPLLATAEDPYYYHKDANIELAQNIVRIKSILFFGSIFLCGLDPPILKVHKVLDTGTSEYVSVVDTSGSENQCKSECPGVQSESDDCLESCSSEESDDSGKVTGVDDEDSVATAAYPQLHSLLAKKCQLERKAKRLQARSKSIQKVLESEVVTEMEIRPHELVPDTNCFIDCLRELEDLMKLLPHPSHPYIIVVPLVVVNELEGLSQGCKPNQNAMHAAMVRETARAAMTLLQNRHPALKCVTTRGTVLNSSAFTMQEDIEYDMKNDDKILTTCVNLAKVRSRDEIKEDGRRKLYREVVLLTEDRSLRLKSLSRDVPVRSLPDFMKWAGLG